MRGKQTSEKRMIGSSVLSLKKANHELRCVPWGLFSSELSDTYVKCFIFKYLFRDAAHKVHPLAGQGVNLGFGDVSTLVQLLSDSVDDGAVLGDEHYLNKYERCRQIHNIPTMLAIDALHRLYKGTAAPIVLARSLGLQVTNAITPLKV